MCAEQEIEQKQSQSPLMNGIHPASANKRRNRSHPMTPEIGRRPPKIRDGRSPPLSAVPYLNSDYAGSHSPRSAIPYASPNFNGNTPPPPPRSAVSNLMSDGGVGRSGVRLRLPSSPILQNANKGLCGILILFFFVLLL